MSDTKTTMTSLSSNNHAQNWNYKYDHDPPQDVTVTHDKNSGTSELDWEDDEFELLEIIEPYLKQGDDRDKEKDNVCLKHAEWKTTTLCCIAKIG
jgi:hypothetical protein